MNTLNRIAMWVLVITLIAGGIMWYTMDQVEFSFSDFDNFDDAVESTIESAIETAGDLKYEIHAEKTVALPESRLTMDVVSSDIYVKFHDLNEVKAVMHGMASTDNEEKLPKLIVSEEGSDVTVQIKWPKLNTSIVNTSIDLEVYIPKSYQGQMRFDSVSGDVFFSDGTYEMVDVSTVSGDLNMNNIETEKVKINTTSGDAIASNIVAGVFSIDTVSGEGTISNLDSESIVVDTTSGDFEFDSVKGQIDFDSVSGSLDFVLSEWVGDIDGDTTSGEVSIFGPDEKISVKLNSTSGDIKSNFTFESVEKKDDDVLIATNSGSDYRVTVDTVSGDIELNH